jgi:hypothetical protein
MEVWVIGIVLTWLAVVSWFDLKKREVPHSLWVIVPLVCAMFYQMVTGNWQLTFLSVVIALVSERQRLAKLTDLKIDTIFFWTPILFAGLYLAGTHNPIGSIAMIGFWLAWELRCWGGADAVASITLVLIWPDIKLILALLVVHAAVALIATMVSLVKERKFRVHHLPGLPLLLFSVLLRSIFFS